MADTKRFGALLVAAASCIGLAAMAAESQHKDMNITGEMQFDAVTRRGTTTFNRAEGGRNASADFGGGTNRNAYTNDESSLIQQKVYLNFGFDLTTNSKAFVQIGGRGLAGDNQDTTNAGAGVVQNGDSSITARIRQAYVELHEVFLPELGLKLGMQDVVMGLDRGDNNHFVMYTPGWGKHYQIRDGGRVERSYSTRSRNIRTGANNAPAAGAHTVGGTSTAANGFDDVGWNDVGTFAWFVTWNQKDMFSANLFYVKLEEEGTGFNDSYLWGTDVKVPLKMINDKSMLMGHLFNVKDSSFAQAEIGSAATGTATADANQSGSGTNFWQYGLGGSITVQDNFEFYAEGAWQDGSFADSFDYVGVLNTGYDEGKEKRQDAYAYYFGASAKIPGAADFKPTVDVSWWSYSGDDIQDDNKNNGFINYGDNKSTMVVEDNDYGIGLSNNYNVWRLKGSVDFDGLLKKGRKTPFTMSYHAFDVNADRVRGTLVPSTARPNGDINPSRLGSEFDISLAHEYSENVTFKVAYGIFWPGMYVRENANLGMSGDGANTAAGMPAGAGDGSAAEVMMFTTSVKF